MFRIGGDEIRRLFLGTLPRTKVPAISLGINFGVAYFRPVGEGPPQLEAILDAGVLGDLGRGFIGRRTDVSGEAGAAEWKGAEPNLWGRGAHRVWHWIDWERRSGPIRRRFGQSEDLALRFVMQPLDRWVAEGWITAEGAEAIRESLQSDGARKVLRFLGMHVGVSFTPGPPGPPGTRSALRFGTVVALRMRDTFRYHQAEISPGNTTNRAVPIPG